MAHADHPEVSSSRRGDVCGSSGRGRGVQLHDGDAGSGLDVHVIGSAVGDLTGDGVEDVAMVVFHRLPGTTGHISSLTVVHDPGTGPVATNIAHISDRARLHDLRLDDSGVLAQQETATDLLIVGEVEGLHLEPVMQTKFTMTYREIGGDFITELDERVTTDETDTLIGTVSGSWDSDFARLHTVILDPAENPDLWCGD